jgi:hypothetical protein
MKTIFFVFLFYHLFVYVAWSQNLKKGSGHWSKPMTWLATVARMREWFPHACNSNQLIILASK